MNHGFRSRSATALYALALGLGSSLHADPAPAPLAPPVPAPAAPAAPAQPAPVPPAPAVAPVPVPAPPAPPAPPQPAPAATQPAPAKPAVPQPAPPAPEPPKPEPPKPPRELAQVPTWSAEDFEYFQHGSISTEMIPEAVLRAFIRIYPDLFPSKDLTHLGLLPDPKFGWPVGISRKEVPHLGALPSLGINCAACHVTDFQPLGGGETIRVIGSAAHFDAEAFFGAIVAASFRTSETPNMKRFLGAYLAESNPADAAKIQPIFEAKWKEQEEKVNAVLIANPFGARDIAPGNLHFLAPGSLQMDLMKVQVAEFPGFVELMVKLFHNMRASIHVPDKPPEKLPPSSGPGRSDAFGYLSAVLLGTPAPYAPVKYGILFNLENRPWVHWDGNTRAPVGRNLLASLGLGAPLIGKKALIDFTGMKRHTELTERIRAPKYPFAINEDAAKRGEAHYQAQCARCHDVPEGEARLHAPAEIGTSTHRIDQFTKEMADGFNALIAGLEMPGYEASPFPGIRSTGKLWALSMPGVWARGPFLHNGSVRTMQELLTPSAERPKKQKRGSRTYDPVQMGFTDEGPYELDATLPHNSNAGHEFGTALTPEEKKDLIEFLKTL